VDVSNPHPSDPAAAGSIASGFKGIALFTPGGDCVYCIDRQKQVHWHIDLCTALQKQLGLVERPYFLLPCFTATIDQWFDADQQQLVTIAEAYPRAMPFQSLLNVLFNQPDLQWQPNYTFHTECAPSLIEIQQQQFPRLWQSHDLILKIDRPSQDATQPPPRPQNLPTSAVASSSYLFKLFVRQEETPATEKMLSLLRQSLETYLNKAYTLQVVDVSKHPEQAENYHISATPTLIQVMPQPTRRIVGNLNNPKQIRHLLGYQG
jgi:circadian clock protein KaiB